MLFGLRLHLKTDVQGRFPSADSGEKGGEHSKNSGRGNGYFGGKFDRRPLVKPHWLHYFPKMLFNKHFVGSALIVCGLQAASADTIQLKGNDAVTGKILAEKPDAVVVDVGYTVLVVPRNAILKISQADNTLTHLTASTSPLLAVNAAGQFYNTESGHPAAASDVRDLVKQIGEAVAQVRTPSGLGSGFFINADGYLITNFHVIEGETEITIEVYRQVDGQLNRETYKKVRIVAINKFQDLALLKIEDKNAPKFKYVTLGNSDPLSVGESVFAIGSPMGLERTVTEGILSTKTREMEGELYLQTTAQINPGNSGGPLFDMAGNVIGVTNMKIMFGEGLGFAIPVELVKNFLDHRDAFAYSTDNPNTPFRYLEPPGPTSRKPAE
jgi:serine protease Do